MLLHHLKHQQFRAKEKKRYVAMSLFCQSSVCHVTNYGDLLMYFVGFVAFKLKLNLEGILKGKVNSL